jgi:hypothetical protein
MRGSFEVPGTDIQGDPINTRAVVQPEKDYLMKIDRSNRPELIATPAHIESEFQEIDAFISQFENHLVGYACMFAGLSYEDAVRAGAVSEGTNSLSTDTAGE